jgi:hypothetical protein
MKLYIPEIGDVIKLRKDWEFTLYNESRNVRLFEAFNIEYVNRYYAMDNIPAHNVKLPKNTELKIDRVYIRKGAADYSSLSFFIQSHPSDDNFKGARFWAKLSDVNEIEFIPVESAINLKIEIKSFVNTREVTYPFIINRSVASYTSQTPPDLRFVINENSVNLKYVTYVNNEPKYETIFSDVVIEKEEVTQKMSTGLFSSTRITYTRFILRDYNCVTVKIGTNEVVSRAKTRDGIKQAIKKLEKKSKIILN